MREQTFLFELDRSVSLSEEELATAKKLALLLLGLEAVKDENRDWLFVSTVEPKGHIHSLAILLGLSSALVVFSFVKGARVEAIMVEVGLSSRDEVLALLHGGLAAVRDVLARGQGHTDAHQRIARLQAHIGPLQIAA